MKLYHIACYDRLRELKCACHALGESKDDAKVSAKTHCDEPTGRKDLDPSAYEVSEADCFESEAKITRLQAENDALKSLIEEAAEEIENHYNRDTVMRAKAIIARQDALGGQNKL